MKNDNPIWIVLVLLGVLNVVVGFYRESWFSVLVGAISLALGGLELAL